METITIDKDISVFYIRATSFPEGIVKAQEQLHALLASAPGRTYFGISRPEKGGTIVYKAGAEELEPGEAKKFHLETMTIKKGTYHCITVKNYTADPSLIKKAFDTILHQPGLDPNGYCIEWYLDEQDVRCMVRLNK